MLVTIFNQIWNENLFLTTKFALSERSRTLQHQKIDRQQYYVDKPVRKSKNILNTVMFFLSPGTLLTSPIDGSRSQLFRTFFWLCCDSYSVPNDHFCFLPILGRQQKNLKKKKNIFGT